MAQRRFPSSPIGNPLHPNRTPTSDRTHMQIHHSSKPNHSLHPHSTLPKRHTHKHFAPAAGEMRYFLLFYIFKFHSDIDLKREFLKVSRLCSLSGVCCRCRHFECTTRTHHEHSSVLQQQQRGRTYPGEQDYIVLVFIPRSIQIEKCLIKRH